MKKNERGYTLVELLVTIVIPVAIIGGIAILYVGGSILASSVKAATEQCDTSLNVPIVADDWFCPEEE